MTHVTHFHNNPFYRHIGMLSEVHFTWATITHRRCVINYNVDDFMAVGVLVDDLASQVDKTHVQGSRGVLQTQKRNANYMKYSTRTAKRVEEPRDAVGLVCGGA